MATNVNGAVRFKGSQIEMAHGAGEKATRRLIEGLIAPLLDNPVLSRLEDAAIIELGEERLALTADSFVVSPLRFPGAVSASWPSMERSTT